MTAIWYYFTKIGPPDDQSLVVDSKDEAAMKYIDWHECFNPHEMSMEEIYEELRERGIYCMQTSVDLANVPCCKH